jgi:hypothetical protein
VGAWRLSELAATLEAACRTGARATAAPRLDETMVHADAVAAALSAWLAKPPSGAPGAPDAAA